MRTKVFVKDLKPGMFVDELDRPWLDTPYLLQGLLIESSHDIAELARYCEYVFIDPLRGHSESHTPTPNELARFRFRKRTTKEDAVPRGSTVYEDAHSAEQEIPLAKEARQTAVEILSDIRRGMETDLKLDIAIVQQAVEGLRDSIVRNPDALLLLTQLRNTTASHYERAINIAVYLLAFGRHLCLTKEDLSELGLGGLLLDVGKLKLPPELLEKNTMYTAAEHALFKRHVAMGEVMLQNIPGVTNRVLEMVSQHHEREDGSGYPRGLRANQSDTFGRMAAIVDCFEDLVIERPHARPVAPHQALQMIHAWGGRFFHPGLVETFIECTGVYPVGSLVELTSGEVGIVVSQNRGSRLQPRLLLVLDPKKSRYDPPKVLDLLTCPENQYGIQYEIGRSLEFGMYGVDPKDYYL